MVVLNNRQILGYVSAQLLLCRHVCSGGTMWTCDCTVATVGTDFAGSSQFPLFVHVWFDIPASKSTEQTIIHRHFPMVLCGLWQLHYSLFTIAFGR